MAKKVVSKKTTKPAKKATKRLSAEDVKVGDRVVFNDGKEKLTLTIVEITRLYGEIDEINCKWRRTRDAMLISTDFDKGYVKLLSKK